MNRFRSIRHFIALTASALLALHGLSANAGCTITVNSPNWSDSRDDNMTMLEAIEISRGMLTGCLKTAEHDAIGGANWYPVQVVPTPSCPASPGDPRYTLLNIPPGPNCGSGYADNILFTNAVSTPIHPSNTIFLGINDDIDGLKADGSHVIIDGPGVGGFAGGGIQVEAASPQDSGNRIRNLDIYDFNGDGVSISKPVGAVIEGLVIGFNTGAGIHLGDGQSNHVPVNTRVGGPNAGNENYIFQNGGDGILVDMDNSFGPLGAGDVIQNNQIGYSDDVGFADQGNSGNGIRVINGSGPEITGNTIGRNAAAGIDFSNVENGTLQGNRIGLPRFTDQARANHAGVVLENGTHNVQLGGAGAGQGNVVSGNTLRGIDISGADVHDNIVEGNTIGLSTAQTFTIGNGEYGVGIADSAHNNDVRGNAISGNAQWGVLLGGSSNNIVENNSIGLRGTLPAPNQLGGVRVAFGATSNTVGPNNRIAGNGGCGVLVEDAGTDHNTISANYIGLTGALGSIVPNASGVCVLGGATNTTIGGSAVANRNYISGNSNDGVLVSGESLIGTPGSGSDNTVIRSNFIGSNTTGAAAQHNGLHGIELRAGSSGTQVIANLLSGNSADGLNINGAILGYVIQNYIGVNAAGTAAMPNGQVGIRLLGGAAGNSIGDPTALGGFLFNAIAGNVGPGVYVTGSNTQQNQIVNDVIGSAGFANSIGVLIDAQAHDNSVLGGVITGNGAAGVAIVSGVHNAIRDAAIYSNGALGIDLGPAGVTANDSADVDGGANGLQNFPVLNNVVIGSNSVTLAANLNSQANQSFNVTLYRSDRCDPSGYGEGQFELGTVTLNTAGSGNGSVAGLMYSVPNSLTKPSWGTAIATSAAGDTSEFGSCVGISDEIFPDNFETATAIAPAADPAATAIQESPLDETRDTGIDAHFETRSDGKSAVTLSIANTTAARVPAQVVSATASAAVIVEDLHASVGGCALAGRIECHLPSLAPGETAAIQMQLTPLEHAPVTLSVVNEVGGKPTQPHTYTLGSTPAQ